MNPEILDSINTWGSGSVAVAIIFTCFIAMISYSFNEKSVKRKYEQKEEKRQKEHSSLCQNLMKDNRQALDNNTNAIKLLAQETKIRNQQFQDYNDRLEKHDERAQRMEIDITELKAKIK